MIINGKNAVLGRLASYAAKKLLAGEEVTIVHAEDVIITGTPKKIAARYLKLRQIGSPQHGPFFPKQPDKIVRRTIRGMMPKTREGRAAFKKLRVYTGSQGTNGEPKLHDAKQIDALRASNASASSVYVKTIRSNYTTVGEVAKLLGWRK